MKNRGGFDNQERTFNLGVRITKFVDKLPHTLSATKLGKQLLHSGTSVAANMEEANGAESKSDFVRILFAVSRKARATRAATTR